MNTLNRRAYALMLTIIVTNAAYGMEAEMVNTVSAEQQEVVVATAWNRKKIVAAVITGAAIAYALAVYMNKVSSPVALWNNFSMPAMPFSNNSKVVNGNEPTDTNIDLSSAVTKEKNVVVTENAPMTQMEKTYQDIATIFRGFKNTGSQKLSNLKVDWNSKNYTH